MVLFGCEAGSSVSGAVQVHGRALISPLSRASPDCKHWERLRGFPPITNKEQTEIKLLFPYSHMNLTISACALTKMVQILLSLELFYFNFILFFMLNILSFVSTNCVCCQSAATDGEEAAS